MPGAWVPRVDHVDFGSDAMVDPQRYNALIDEIEDLEDKISILEARLNPDDRTPLEDFEAELAGEPRAEVG